MTCLEEESLTEKNSEGLKCPHSNCGEKFTQEDVKAISNSQKTVDQIADIMTMELLKTMLHSSRSYFAKAISF